MKCPVCGKELDEKTIFCPNCGQAISQPDTSSASFNSYWNENNAASQKHITEQKEKAAEVLSEIRKKRTATFFRFVILCIAICVIALFAVVKNSNNKQALSAAHESMIGKTYSDTSASSFWVGDSCDRKIVTITDEETLEYTKGNYRSHMSESNKLSWSENEIYETATYAYDLSISFWGKVSILINGETYEVNLDDDGSVRSINFYK